VQAGSRDDDRSQGKLSEFGGVIGQHRYSGKEILQGRDIDRRYRLKQSGCGSHGAHQVVGAEIRERGDGEGKIAEQIGGISGKAKAHDGAEQRVLDAANRDRDTDRAKSRTSTRVKDSARTHHRVTWGRNAVASQQPRQRIPVKTQCVTRPDVK
jgi:hypothetical protein